MRPLHHLSLPLLVLLVLLVLLAGSARARDLVTGFNQAWWRTHYGSQWVSGWDEAEAQRLVRATRDLGGRVLRVWLFEGLTPEGVVFDHDPAKSAYGYPGRRHRATGLVPEKLAHLGRFLELCEAAGVQAYLTLFDGNVYSFSDPAPEHRRAEWWNLLNELYGAGDAFREAVLAPVLAVAAAHPGAVFGVDLINEGNALVSHHWFGGGWRGADAFVARWGGFVRARLAAPVTMSLGHHTAVPDMLAGHPAPGLVDHYDFHVYDDAGRIPQATAVARLAATKPVYLGEYGQRAKAFDDALQVRALGGFLTEARRLGLAGALAWRLSDVRPGPNPEARFSFEADGAWRPAAAEHRRLSRRR